MNRDSRRFHPITQKTISPSRAWGHELLEGSIREDINLRQRLASDQTRWETGRHRLSGDTKTNSLLSLRAERSPRPYRRRSAAMNHLTRRRLLEHRRFSSAFGESTAYYSSGGPALRGRPRMAGDGSLLSCHPEDDECSKGEKISPQSSGPEVRNLWLMVMCNVAADWSLPQAETS